MFSLLRTTCLIPAAIIALSVAIPSNARAESSYHLRNGVMGAAGNTAASADYASRGTAGQSTPTGIGSTSINSLYAGFWSMQWVLASVLGGPEKVLATGIFQNYPNPFTGSTTIAYAIASESDVEISVFNVRGQRVRALVNERAVPGSYLTTWDGRDEAGARAAPGVYFYRLSVGDYRAVKKMLLLR